jgi:hypothetical protein
MYYHQIPSPSAHEEVEQELDGVNDHKDRGDRQSLVVQRLALNFKQEQCCVDHLLRKERTARA